MPYKVICVTSGSYLDGLDIIFTELQETDGKNMRIRQLQNLRLFI